MLIGQDGALTPAQEAKLAAQKEADAQDAKERARIAKLSRKSLVHEIRKEIRTTGKTNHLAFCVGLGLGLLVILGESLATGVDPYCRQRANKTPKRTRQRGTATAVKA